MQSFGETAPLLRASWYSQSRGPAQPSCFVRRAGLWPPSNRRRREGKQAGRSTSELHRYKYTLGPWDLAIHRCTVLRWCHPMLGCIYSFVHCSLGFFFFFFCPYMPFLLLFWCLKDDFLELPHYLVEKFLLSLTASPLDLYFVTRNLAPPSLLQEILCRIQNREHLSLFLSPKSLLCVRQYGDSSEQ